MSLLFEEFIKRGGVLAIPFHLVLHTCKRMYQAHSSKNVFMALEMRLEIFCSLIPSLSAPVFTSLAVRKTEGEPGRFDQSNPGTATFMSHIQFKMRVRYGLRCESKPNVPRVYRQL